MFLPDYWPAYYDRADGCYIWDLDGNKYIDMSSMGVGACVLGYADKDVNRAVKRAIDNCSMTTLNCFEDLELAKLLCRLHPWAEMVRYARTGGEAMTVAVRIARAFSKKDKIAFCGYHGWSDWYLAANLADNKNLDGHLLSGLDPSGVPRQLKGTALPFAYNDIEGLKKIILRNKDIGVIIMEPLRHKSPENDFLKKVKKIAKDIKAVLIFDEITIGWRMNNGGVHLKYGVNPDIAVFAKGMSNGFPMAAIIGREEIMQAAQKSFISSTYWTERIGPVAALETIKKIIRNKVPAYLDKIGWVIEQGWQKSANKYNLKIKIIGPYPLITFSFEYGKDSQAIKTLFIQEMLKRGFLATTSVYVSYAHKIGHVKKYLKATDEVFKLLSETIKKNKVYNLLEGPVAQTSFKRLTD
jgi:glutamate-1-semialdehyde aminotransferase